MSLDRLKDNKKIMTIGTSDINQEIVVEIPMQYGGSEMKKGIRYNGEIYMMKFPDPIRKKKIELSYMNNQFSEHIGCEIFKSCGIKTQDTLIRKFKQNDIEKIVVLCKDFTTPSVPLIEMSTLVNADISSGHKKDLSIESVYEILENSTLIRNVEETKEKFWDMFVIDALIGNTDRHYGNWGFLKISDELVFSPIYDCGSSLGALVSEEMKLKYLDHPEEFKNKEYNVTTAYRMHGKRVFYHTIFNEPPTDLIKAINRVIPKINMKEISHIIKTTSYITEIHKEYLIHSIRLRYDNILFPSYIKFK